MPICPACGIGYLEGESHVCAPRASQAEVMPWVYLALALLALGGALVPFPFLGLLGFPIMLVAPLILCAALLRLGKSNGMTRWRTAAGVVCLLAGTVTLILATFATPAGFVVVLTPTGFTHLMRPGPYHFIVPVRFAVPVRLGPIKSFSIPVLWVGSASLLALGATWRARLSFSTAVGLFALTLAMFPLCALLFLLLSTFWRLSV